MNDVSHYEPELAAALEAVELAAMISERVRDSLTRQDTHTKDDLSPVTVADFAVQAAVTAVLSRTVKGIPMCAEEDNEALEGDTGSLLRSRVTGSVQQVLPDLQENDVLDFIGQGTFPGGGSGRFWTLDPIDGTKGFLRGDQYAIALALIDNGEPVLGVMGCPRLSLYSGDREAGPGLIAWAAADQPPVMRTIGSHEELPLFSSSRVDPGTAVFCESVESGHSNHSQSMDIVNRLGSRQQPRRLDSQAKYAVVASGEADCYLRLPTRKDYREKIWDHAAGAFLIQRAGGVVTDVDGKPLDFSKGRRLEDNRGIIACSAGLHSVILSAVQAVLG